MKNWSLTLGCNSRGHESREYPQSKRKREFVHACALVKFFFFSIQTESIDNGPAPRKYRAKPAAKKKPRLSIT